MCSRVCYILRKTDIWQFTYVEKRQVRMKETLKIRFIRNLIFSLMNKDNVWTNVQLTNIKMLSEKEDSFSTLKNFRVYIRIKNSHESTAYLHSAIAANGQPGRSNQPTTLGDGRTTFKGQIQPMECLCGLVHWYSRCYYLNVNKRPPNWIPNPEIAMEVEKVMKDEKIRNKVESSIQRSRGGRGGSVKICLNPLLPFCPYNLPLARERLLILPR